MVKDRGIATGGNNAPAPGAQRDRNERKGKTMTRRKILLVALSVAMVAILAVGGSLAYFTARKDVSNVFTVGNVKITLTEPAWIASGFVDGDTVYPGEPLKKDPRVTNVGKNPCFVRIKVEGLDTFVPAGTSDAEKGNYMIRLRTNYVLDALGDNWVRYGDYYYYSKVVDIDPGTGTDWNPDLAPATTPLFDSIVIPTTIGNGYEPWWTYNVKVTAEAVQAQGAKSPNWDAVKGMSVPEIATWFTTCGL
jgi:predicted ribosomally synthesized peptide with SipW-like signal peptide